MSDKKLTLAVPAVLVLTATVSFAQMGTGRVTGTVTDPEGNAVEGAVITVVDAIGRELDATSNEDGRWAILGFRTGTYDFSVVADGYQPKIETKSVRETGPNELDIVLTPVAAAPASEEDTELLREANALLKQQQYPQAIAKYRELLEAQPSFYQLHEYIGVAYREMGDLESALEEFHEVLEHDANHADALISIGDILVTQGELDEAVEYFEKAVSQTTDAIVPFNVAEIYFSRQNAEEAIEYYRIAAEYKPEWPDPHLKLGYAYLNTGDIESAKASFQKVIEIAPDSPQAQMAQTTLSSLP